MRAGYFHAMNSQYLDSVTNTVSVARQALNRYFDFYNRRLRIHPLTARRRIRLISTSASRRSPRRLETRRRYLPRKPEIRPTVRGYFSGNKFSANLCH